MSGMTLGEVVQLEDVQQAILNHVKHFHQLPANLKQIMGSQRGYDRVIIKYSLKHQLCWKDSLVKLVVADEKAYYQELVNSSLSSYMLYPYHLQLQMCKGLHISATLYYKQMLTRMMTDDSSYDTLPNFTAVDCVRLLGIGRNEYINLMNENRATITKGVSTNFKSLFTSKKKPKYAFGVHPALPEQPLETVPLMQWYICHVSFVSESDIKKLESPIEVATIDMLIDNGGACVAGAIDYNVVKSLFRKGLTYFSIPLSETGEDVIEVLSLEAFVMNRVLGDWLERLLYKLFVAIDGRLSIAELASVLGVDLRLTLIACSIYIRLGLARLKGAPPLSASHCHESWRETMPDQEVQPLLEQQGEGHRDLRIGILFDSSLTGFLMMGNVGAGLKQFAVTMFEVGRLPDEQLDVFLGLLSAVSLGGEGEAKRYFSHAVAFYRTIAALRHHEKIQFENCAGGIDLLRCESLLALPPAALLRLLDGGYSCLISLSPLHASHLIPAHSSLPSQYGPPSPTALSPWMLLLISCISSVHRPPILFLPHGFRLQELPKAFKHLTLTMIVGDDENRVVHRACNLPIINDALRTSSVCITTMPPEDTALGRYYFPVMQEDAPPEVVNLHEQLGLANHFGALETAKYGDNIVCVGVIFGQPLDDPENAREVVEKQLLNSGLLTTEGASRHQKSSTELKSRLMAFAREHGGVDVGDGPPIPSKPLYFDGDAITQMDSREKGNSARGWSE